ncbi:hypothetical protein C8J57DRAFT_1505040 [Mycena rebaudengoi]|nr:hypothetical protein C8J57DRAFT_1505040 [Mycena rebaudengoi]
MPPHFSCALSSESKGLLTRWNGCGIALWEVLAAAFFVHVWPQLAMCESRSLWDSMGRDRTGDLVISDPETPQEAPCCVCHLRQLTRRARSRQDYAPAGPATLVAVLRARSPAENTKFGGSSWTRCSWNISSELTLQTHLFRQRLMRDGRRRPATLTGAGAAEEIMRSAPLFTGGTAASMADTRLDFVSDMVAGYFFESTNQLVVEILYRAPLLPHRVPAHLKLMDAVRGAA